MFVRQTLKNLLVNKYLLLALSELNLHMTYKKFKNEKNWTANGSV
jgi:hypothetical protein